MPTFVHPGLAAAGAVLAAVPILIHLISRRQFVRQPWAAMAFLKRAHRHTRRRMRLERLLLLALRTTAVVLMGLAVARPLLSASIAGLSTKTRVDRVLILDDSGSMQARTSSGRTAFDEARRAALTLLDSFGPTDGVAVVMASAPARGATPQLVYDPAAVRRVIEGLTCGYGVTDPAAALDVACELLRGGRVPVDLRQAYVLSDLAGPSWTAQGSDGARPVSAAAERLQRLARLNVVNLGGPVRENAAILDAVCEDRLVGCEWPVTIAARVANRGKGTLRDAQLELREDGRLLRKVAVEPIAPQGERRVVVRTQFRTAGSHGLALRLVRTGATTQTAESSRGDQHVDTASSAAGMAASKSAETVGGSAFDALPTDDVRYLSLDVVRQQRVLLVDGRPGPPESSEGLYISRALHPSNDAGDRDPFDVQTIGEADLATTALGDVRTVILASVRSLPASQWQRLTKFVREGGGLWWIAGDQTQAGGDEIADIAPARLDRITDAAESPAPGATSTPESRSSTTLEFADAAHPILADFDAQSPGGLLSARFVRHWKVEPTPDARTILRFRDGTPALIERTVGAGRAALWTAGANMAWGNLPAKPDFVPLVMNVVAHLAPRGDAGRNVRLGQTFVEPVDPATAAAGLALRAPDGGRSAVSPTSSDGRLLVRLDTGRPPIDRPGDYGLLVGRGERRVAVNADTAESDLQPPDAATLRTLFGPDANLATGVAFATAAPAHRDLSDTLCALLLIIVLAESFAAVWFGGRG